MKNKSVLAEKIKTARKSVGLSQRDMGKILKLSDKAVSSYEVGRAAPNLDALRQIAEVTHKPISYFVEETVDEESLIEVKIKMIEKELSEIKELLIQKKQR